MSKKKVYASLEIADQEIRLVVLEIFDGRYNVLRTESVECQGVVKQKIVDEANVVTSIRQAVTNAQAALGYRIERVLLAIPSVNVQRNNQKIHVMVDDGTKSIRLFHIQQGYNKAIQRRVSDDVEFVNANRVLYIVNDEEIRKVPVSKNAEDFYMDIDLLYADKETIYSYARCVEQANLEILDLCLDSYAIAQQAAVLVQSYDRLMIQVDLEEEHCTISLFQKGRMMNTITLETGYMSFIEDLQKEYALSNAVSYRLLQNVLTSDVEEAKDIIVYIEQKEDTRIEITEKQLVQSVLPKMQAWIDQVNDACDPIVKKAKSRYLLTGKGANISTFKELEKKFNADARVYEEMNMGARSGAYVCCLGMAYAWNEINEIRHSDKISVNNNELEASIDTIRAKTKANEDGNFTKKLKNVILTERD
ncbi:MAG: hypothetical protein HUJ53_07955 [Holdemanella sp.]|nr:hypothetical protein [Holdemanella sp.]